MVKRIFETLSHDLTGRILLLGMIGLTWLKVAFFLFSTDI